MKVTNKEIFLDDLENLKEYINKKENLLLWGAGFYLNLLFDKCSAIDENFKKKIEFIIVSDIKDNPTEVEGIPVREYSNKVNLNGKTIILALGHRYKKDIIGVIAEAGAEVVTVDFNIFQENTYHNILKMIEPFMLVYPFNSTSTNMPCFGNRTKMLFTCWWQGEEEAPALIRACIRSQKRNIPKEIRHVVISKYNYGEYIDIPDFVLQKVESGKISLTTLSDIIRVSLLYKWGGGWM